MYHPGRPVPITNPQAQATVVQGKPDSTQESLHIWEQPLPREPMSGSAVESGTYQNQGSMVTMPCRGTMAGHAKAGDTETQSQIGTWGGTKALYDPNQGWQNIT